MGETQLTRAQWVRSLLEDTAGERLVKLCGMSCQEDVDAVNLAAPDLCGFVVNVTTSTRGVTTGELRRLALRLDRAVASVGVFANEQVDVIASLADDGVIDMAQLDGTEDEGYLRRLREACDVPILQSFRVRTPADVARANVSSADMVLLDGGHDVAGCLDQSLLAHVVRPFMLAGNLTPTNVVAAIVATGALGVDMSGGIETNGTKDAGKIAAAVDAVRAETTWPEPVGRRS